MTLETFAPLPQAKQQKQALVQTMEDAIALVNHLRIKADEVKRLRDPALDAAAHAADIAARRAAAKAGDNPFALGSAAADALAKEREEALYELEADLVEAGQGAARGIWRLGPF